MTETKQNFADQAEADLRRDHHPILGTLRRFQDRRPQTTMVAVALKELLRGLDLCPTCNAPLPGWVPFSGPLFGRSDIRAFGSFPSATGGVQWWRRCPGKCLGGLVLDPPKDRPIRSGVWVWNPWECRVPDCGWVGPLAACNRNPDGQAKCPRCATDVVPVEKGSP